MKQNNTRQFSVSSQYGFGTMRNLVIWSCHGETKEQLEGKEKNEQWALVESHGDDSY